ncbi:MAG: hypothetical protein IPJ65_27185 [Archangiaceae bacterium]|nr:hypothetical protein [Archangiaceae bacterium]
MTRRVPPSTAKVPTQQTHTVKVQDDVGLEPVNDSAVQHHYVALTQDMLDQVTQSRAYEQLFGVESRANTKIGAPGGWTNVILPGEQHYTELIPYEVAGEYPLQLGIAMAVQSDASAQAAQSNLEKLFDDGSATDVLLDVKDNRKPGDLTVPVEPTVREIPQWSVGKDKETGKPAFEGDWIGAWGTDEKNLEDHRVLSLQETLAPHFREDRLGLDVREVSAVAGVDDAANLAKMFAAHGFEVEVEGVARGAEAPRVSALNAYLRQQDEGGLTLVARAPVPGSPVMRIRVDEDEKKQGFVSETIQLKAPAPATVKETAVAPDGTRVTLSAKAGETTATLSGVKPAKPRKA